MIHVGTTPVCLKRQEKNSRVLRCAYARAGCAAAHRCHSQPFGTLRASPTFASQTFWHAAAAALSSIGAGRRGRQSAVKVGHGVLAISVAAGMGADVMAGGAGAAGPAPDVRHPPPGYPDLLPYNTGYTGLSRDIQTYPQNKVIPGYPELSRDNPTWCLSRDNP